MSRATPLATLDTTHDPSQRGGLRERLTAVPVLNASGQVVEPGEAAPFPRSQRVPTMLSDRELNYLHWLGASAPANAQMVELGSFLGGSTAALVEGLRASGRSHRPVLVYDAFLAPSSAEAVNSWWMKPFGLSAGENFRSKYEALHASRLDRLCIREGWIPENADVAGQRRLYPEQRPIDVLFVDAAKSWDVHRTILHTFARHLRPGSVVVQQDFLDIQTPWLPIHMWQLREAFRPLDHVRASPSMAFECIADPSRLVDEAWANDRFRDREVREELWGGVIAYWHELIGTAAGFLHGHAARHAALVGDFAGVLRPARRYEAWLNSRESEGVYATPTWGEVLHALAEGSGPHAAALGWLAVESDVRRSLTRYGSQCSSSFLSYDVRSSYWRGLIERLKASGIDRIALFGAGAHTQWLLSSWWRECGVRIECILDDDSGRAEVCGVPVRRPADVRLAPGVAIVPSSDAHEDAILRRASEVFGADSPNPVFRVYTGEQRPVPVAAVCCASPSLVRTDARHLEADAPHRVELGLPERRPWIGAFAERLGVPAWAKGYVNYRDAQFLWDLVEAVRPDVIAEIGTASGVSTGLLAAAADLFGGTTRDRGTVHSFDIADRCYFDQSRPVGAAALEALPHLRDAIRLNPCRTAIDAAKSFGVGEVDLAFIDGDHRHPTPTLDLLALLYAIKPGAWVVLHDIELTEVAKVSRANGRLDWDVVTGAETLFHRWPFQKTQPRHPNAWQNNIGAIRLPMNPGEAAGFLLEHLKEAWEINDPAPLIRAALRAA